MTGQSSADPDQLDGWAKASRGLDEPLTRQQRWLEALHDQFSASSRWGSFDATRLIGSLRTYIGHNETDAQWTSTISEAFRQADSAGGLTSPGGVMRLPDTAIGAALTKAGLMKARPPEVPLGQRDPGLRSTEADRQAFRTQHGLYGEQVEAVRQAAARNPAFRGIPEEDLVGIHSYTAGGWFRKVNKAFRNGDIDTLESYRGHIRVTTSGLNQLPAYEGRVYRHVDPESPEELEMILAKYKGGTVVTERQFLSTSKKRTGATDILFVITSRSGRDVEKISANPEEAEVLFGPGARFEVVGDPVRVPIGDQGRYRWEITLDEVE